MPYPMELYKGGTYRVTFSQEEHGALIADGWTVDRPSGKVIVHTAGTTSAPKPAPAQPAPAVEAPKAK